MLFVCGFVCMCGLVCVLWVGMESYLQVVSFRGADLSCDRTALVYEYMPGNCVEKYVKCRTLSEQEVCIPNGRAEFVSIGLYPFHAIVRANIYILINTPRIHIHLQK